MAAALPLVAAVAGSMLLSKVLTPKPKVVKPLPAPTRSTALDRAASNDALARRRGTDANKMTGYGGSEAFTGPKKSLLGR